MRHSAKTEDELQVLDEKGLVLSPDAVYLYVQTWACCCRETRHSALAFAFVGTTDEARLAETFAVIALCVSFTLDLGAWVVYGRLRRRRRGG